MNRSTSAPAVLADLMPAMVAHEGIWEGIYTHVDADGVIIDRHQSRVECIFPATGDVVYLQRNLFTWDEGREYRAELPGIIKDGKLWWDTDTFHGYAWETEFGLIMLNLQRKDVPNANFYEVIALGDTGEFRSRTWHWFKDGKLFKRTLCEEQRVSQTTKQN